MNCNQAQRLLLEASEAPPAALLEHVGGCAACQQVAACVRWLQRESLSPAPTPALDEAIRQAARQRLEGRRWRRWPRPGRRLLAVAASVAVVAGLLAGLLVIGSGSGSPGLAPAAGRTSGRVLTWTTAQVQLSAIEAGLDAMVAELNGDLPSLEAAAVGGGTADGWDALTELEFGVYIESQNLGQADG